MLELPTSPNPEQIYPIAFFILLILVAETVKPLHIAPPIANNAADRAILLTSLISSASILFHAFTSLLHRSAASVS